MAQQHFARFDPGVLLLFVQVFQLVDVILTLGFTFLQVDIRKNSLYYQYLKMIKENKPDVIPAVCQPPSLQRKYSQRTESKAWMDSRNQPSQFSTLYTQGLSPSHTEWLLHGLWTVKEPDSSPVSWQMRTERITLCYLRWSMPNLEYLFITYCFLQQLNIRVVFCSVSKDFF